MNDLEVLNEYLRKAADMNVGCRRKALEIKRFIDAYLKMEADTIIEGDLTISEAIKSFEEFKIGDVVLWNGDEELEVVGLPVFKHKIYYSSGEHSEHECEGRWHGCKFKNQEVLGYLLKDHRDVVFRLHILSDLRLK